MTASLRAMLRFGSLYGRLESARQEYTDALALVFGVGLHPLTQDQETGRHFDLVIADSSALPGGDSAGLNPNCLTLGGTPRHPTIATDALRAELDLDRQPVDIRLVVLRDDVPFPALCVHFGVIIHKILFYLDRVILHAAAVQVDGVVSLFVGDKGAGKSTTCLALARAGGTVLGEDQVILRRSGARYLVSGGDERSRVTERTERHFFPEPLAVPARDFAGTMKKEIRTGAFFRSEPFRDFPPHRLLFPRVDGRFQLRPLKGQQALRRMLAYNGHFQRFEGARDQADFLDFLAGFITTVSCWELSLSDDLTQLDLLAETLRSA
jgi:hypothetical protein